MIEATSIRKMFKPYTSRQLAAKMGAIYDEKTKTSNPILPRVQNGVWSNGHITFWETAPKAITSFGIEESETLEARMTEITDKATIRAWPVMMGQPIKENGDTATIALIKFAIECRKDMYFDARYIATLLKHAKSRKKDKVLEWFYNPQSPNNIKLIGNGKLIGTVCKMTLTDELETKIEDISLYSWRFVNPDVDTPFLSPEEEQDYIDAQEAKVDAVKTPEDVASDYTQTQAQALPNSVAVAENIIEMLENADDPVKDIKEQLEHELHDNDILNDIADALETMVDTPPMADDNAQKEEAKVANIDNAPWDINGSEYGPAIRDAQKIKVTKSVLGGLITETGLVAIENVAKGKRAYKPNPEALEIVCETLPEDAFYLGLWCTTTNKVPGKTHFELAQSVWDDEGPGIVVITKTAIFGIGKDEKAKSPNKLKVIFEFSK